MTNWNWKYYGIQFRTFFPRVLTMFCQAVRITFSSCSCLDLAVSPCVSCRSHVWKVFLPNHLKSQTNEMPDDKVLQTCYRVWTHTNSPLGQLLSWYETVWPPCCWSLFQLYHNTVKSNPIKTKEMFAWLTDFDHQQAPDLARLSAAQCCSWLYFAAEALVLLCVRQNNKERCCRLKCSGSSPQMPSCWLGRIRCRPVIHRAGD